MLILIRYGEGLEYEQEDEHIVHAQGLLDHIGGVVFHRRIGAHVQINEYSEDDGQGDPETGKQQRLLERNGLLLTVEHEQVKAKQEQDQQEEQYPVRDAFYHGRRLAEPI
ncbi:hypothetical protein SDC9_162792 [bioreactor metagenome]|uniref:Uncharacterized protein n=1 Tax=bioreactor metagenome TaxID=1076179 RepID=A0A645FM18_9ZZZZ